MLRDNKILGLAVEERAILAAEMQVDGDQCKVRRTAEFSFPEKLNFEECGELGKLLGQFLRKNKFSAKVAVVGIPAKWAAVKEKTVPSTNAESLAGILQIQAERDFSLDCQELVLDFTGKINSVGNSNLLIVAALKKRIENIVAIGKAAGIKVRSVTLSSLALAAANKDKVSSSNYLLYTRGDYAEFVAQNSEHIHMIKHLPFNAEAEGSVKSLAGNVHNLISFLPGDKRASGSCKLVTRGESDLANAAIVELKKRLDPNIEVIGESSGESGADGFEAARSLGLSATQEEPLAIDFLNSRIYAKKETNHKRLKLWSAITCTVLLVIIISMIWGWQQDKNDIALLKEHYESMREEVEEAAGVVEKVTFTRGWYSGRPKFLDCLRGLTLSFPEEGTIWVTSLAIKEDMEGIITGKAVSERNVLDVLDSMKQSGTFSKVQLEYMRDAGRNSREVSFAINYVFESRD